MPYLEMCQREGVGLQRGMNFELRDNHSVILMSVRPNAPYADRLEDDGTTLTYEGHDEPRSPKNPNPKTVDQPAHTPAGSLTQNGLFHRAAQPFKSGEREPERVRVYEKIKQGIWSYNGIFHLVDSWQESSEDCRVFKFKLVAVEGEEDFSVPVPSQSKPRRIDFPLDVTPGCSYHEVSQDSPFSQLLGKRFSKWRLLVGEGDNWEGLMVSFDTSAGLCFVSVDCSISVLTLKGEQC